MSEPIKTQSICEECGGSGSIDSEGFTPWGAPIDLPCPACSNFGKPLPKIEPLKIDLDKLQTAQRYDHAGRAKHDAAVDAMAARAQRRREQVQSEISRELDALQAQALTYERLAKLTWEKWENLKEMAGL